MNRRPLDGRRCRKKSPALTGRWFFAGKRQYGYTSSRVTASRTGMPDTQDVDGPALHLKRTRYVPCRLPTRISRMSRPMSAASAASAARPQALGHRLQRVNRGHQLSEPLAAGGCRGLIAEPLQDMGHILLGLIGQPHPIIHVRLPRQQCRTSWPALEGGSGRLRAFFRHIR